MRTFAVVAAAVAAGARVLALVPIDVLRQLLGGGLLMVGGFWLVQSAVKPQAAQAELAHERQAAERRALRGPAATALVSAKAVLIEGAEAAVLVVAIGAPQHALAAAVAGATAAAIVVVVFARLAHRRLERVTARSLTRFAGTALVLVGTFWLTDGSHLGAGLTASALATAGVAAAAMWWSPWRTARRPDMPHPTRPPGLPLRDDPR